MDNVDELKPEVTAPGAHCPPPNPFGFTCTNAPQGVRAALANSDDGTAPIQGTSQSTPHVAGLAALIMEARPSINVASVKHAIIATSEPRTHDVACTTCTPICTPLGCCVQPSPYPGWDCRWGWGYMDAYAAAHYVLTLQTDVTFPTYPPNPVWLSPDISVTPFPIQPNGVHTATVQIKNFGPTAVQKVRVHFGVSVFSATPAILDDFGTRIVDLPANSTTPRVHAVAGAE